MTRLEPILSEMSDERKLSPQPRKPKGLPPHAKKPLHFLDFSAGFFFLLRKRLFCRVVLR